MVKNQKLNSWHEMSMDLRMAAVLHKSKMIQMHEYLVFTALTFAKLECSFCLFTTSNMSLWHVSRLPISWLNGSEGNLERERGCGYGSYWGHNF